MEWNEILGITLWLIIVAPTLVLYTLSLRRKGKDAE